MPMMEIPGLVGPSNRLASPNVSVERSVNCFPESAQPGVPKVPQWLRKRPGITPFSQASGGTGKAEFAQDGRSFGVSGGIFFEQDSAGNVTEYTPTMATDDNPATISSNGTAGQQLFITSGGNGYIFSLEFNTLTEITDPDFPSGRAIMGEFMEGYFIVLRSRSRRFQISALENGLSWDGLDVAERSLASDNIIFLKRVNTLLWLIGSKTSEPWDNVGDPDFPFAPAQNMLMEQGAIAPFGGVRIGDTLVWLSQNENGEGLVIQLNGFQPITVSTLSVSRDLQIRGDLSATTAFCMQMQGHTFYLLDTVIGETTWAWDMIAGQNGWHEWAEWNDTTCQFEPFLGSCHCFAFGKNLVGNRLNQYVYEVSFDVLEDEIV